MLLGLKRVLVLALIVLPALVLMALLRNAYFQREEVLLELIDKYDRLRSVSELKLEQLGKHLAQPELETVFLSGASSSVITSDLQSKLRAVAAQNNVEVIQASELTFAVSEDGLKKLGVRLEMVGGVQGVAAVLKAIRSYVPILYADNVTMRSNEIPGQLTQTEPPISLGIDVWGVSENTVDGASQ